MEINEYRCPQAVKGGVAPVQDKKIEELGRNTGVVNEGWWLAPPRLGGIKARAFFVTCVKLNLALQHRIETLDRSDDHFGGRVDRVCLETLDGIERREFSRVVGRFEIGKLVLSLFA